MMVQYSKFIKVANESWRKDFSWGSLNYIETSTWARQEHNGFSHQNPGFIGAILDLKPSFARVYLPPDANCFLSTVAHCLRAKKYINLMVGSKQPTPVWLTPEEANAVSFFSVHTKLHPYLFFPALHCWCISVEIRQRG
jgi:xylulose-5-phosphate/fructose-6-phosphate phosphoketolase